ncbi:MAG: HAMP domain-containing histidine kinase [Actinomycetota bacterium]|nr:HAMP domain-containing histidine kinase [Actinomycetota bacterium]
MNPSDADRLILRAASRKVSIQIAAVCASVVAVVIAAAVLFVIHRSQPAEIIDHSAAPGRIYIDARDGLLALVLAGVLGVALAGVVGLLSARRAARPLGEALARQRRFVQDASHQLRTPLAVLDARVQLAQRRIGPDSPATDTLAQLRRDSAALTELVNDLLLMSADQDEAEPEPVDAAGAVSTVVEDLQILAAQAGVGLVCVATAAPRVHVQAHLLCRMVTALVENALSHTPPDGQIGITVSARAGQARISVGDTGPGVTGIDPDQVFDRFARGDPAGQEPSRRSYGIGLALVKEAALRHGGDVAVTDTGPHGTTVTLTLPAA